MPTYIAYYTIFPRAIGGRLYSDAIELGIAMRIALVAKQGIKG